MKSRYKKQNRWISLFMANVVALSSVITSMPISAFASLPKTDKTQSVSNESNENNTETDVARVYVNNTPIRLEVSKIKTPIGEHEGLSPNSYADSDLENSVTYKWSGRMEGTVSHIIQTYGSENVELAYAPNGTYLGYGWKKGTLEYLELRKENESTNNESVDIKYNEYGVFSGYAYITKELETTDNNNRYIAGAVMTLYDAVEVYKNPKMAGDDRFPGVVVERNSNGDITSVYVEKGYAGSKVEYVLSNGDGSEDASYDQKDEINDTGKGKWIAKTIDRSDTPILYYNLNDLIITTNDTYFTQQSENNKEIDKVFGANRFDKEGILYGINRDGDVVNATQQDEFDFTLFAFRKGDTNPVFEFEGGDYNEIKYNSLSKTIDLGEGTIMYHLDEDGNRDAKVDPRTGIAYVTEDMLEDEIAQKTGEPNIVNKELRLSSYNTYGRIYVWPVNIFKDRTGSEQFQKIKTSRLATINEDTEDEYITGTYTGTELAKKLNPTYDENGLPIYYQKSDQKYVKGADLFDRDGDYLGYGYTDKLDAENPNAYQVKDHENLYNGDADDPFDQSTHYQYSTEQKIKVTIDMAGNYIVNGADTVPKPRRSGKVFAGWLIDPASLTDGARVNASWKVAGSSMSEDQKEKWYSNRAATGNTKTITVTFGANGGEFWDGSGAIHSSDNELYFRQGESYIIENTWMTGENTPNNPFDDRIVATIDQTSNTANDPYRALSDNGEQKGGNVDTIKRLNAGLYIMEELNPAIGYTKGFPVGVNVEKNETVQSTEIVDTTIKVEISKVDAAKNHTFNLYRDGVLVTDPSGVKETVQEPKGSYSFDIVSGARLAIYGNNADNTDYSNWVKATSLVADSDKFHDNSHGDYIVVDSSNPIYMEGLPAGNYIISEILTPDGYITAPDTAVKINEEKDVQLVLITDDHTKVEVKKYYNDGNANVVMPNTYKAGLQLKDKNGSVISEWYTDDVSSYRNFMTTFEELVKDNHGSAFDSIHWNADMSAVRQSASDTLEKWLVSDGETVLIENGNFPANASEEFKAAYANRNLATELENFSYTIPMSATRVSGNPTYQIWETNAGSHIQICVYEDNDFNSSGSQKYICEYKFNYRDDYSGSYKNMVSYDTVDGLHRFDYIPVGDYILHEFDVPEGFMLSADKQIEVKETGDVQQYTMLNKQRELVVTKVAQDHEGLFYAGVRNNEVSMKDTGIEISGAKLRLYKVDQFSEAYKTEFKNGSVPASAVLMTEWISGNDGVYTNEDNQKEKIPSGYQVGDLKPHTIKDLEDGYYYLVEANTPDYYKTTEPLEVEVDNQKSELTVVNKKMPGKVMVEKVNENNKALAGAVFTVKNKTTGTIAGYIITDDTGKGVLIIDDIGRIGRNGIIDPYVFTVEETSPPPGYQINSEIHEFTFKGTDHDDYAMTYNVNDAAHTNGVIKVVDSETAITISKTDFDTHMGVPGATLSIFEAVNENGEWKLNENVSAIDEWITASGTTTHVINGLAGSGNYVLSETGVPNGYVKADDIFFRVSNDGKSISQMWTDPTKNTYIEFHADNTGAVEKVNFVTKTFSGSKTVLTDLNDNTMKQYGTATNGFTLTSSEITQGHNYRLDEVVRFTDNTETTIRSTTFLANLSDGHLKIYPKNATSVENLVTDRNGSIIAKWISDGSIYSIENPLETDTQGITVLNTTTGNRIPGQDHEAVSAGKQIIYTIKYNGANKEVVLNPDNKTDIIRTEPAVERSDDGMYRFTTTEDQGEIKFIATVKDTASGSINQKVTIEDRTYSYMNPIAVNEGTGFLKNTSKIVLFNDIQGNNPTNELASFTYRVTLTDANGNPLSGSYSYRTKNENNGTHNFDAFGSETTFDVTLLGTDYLVIDDLPYNTKYSVKLLITNDYDFSVQSGTVNDYGHPINLPTGSTSKENISNIYFSNTRNLSNERTIFQRNESYELVERVIMNDNTQFTLAQTGFTLGENCEVTSFDIKNRKYPVLISKRQITGEEELPGATLQILDNAGNIIEEWTSTDKEHVVISTLTPGESYILREYLAPDGYLHSDDIVFTVSLDGTINRVVMYDTYTKVYIEKVDENNKPVVGAVLQILDSDNKVVEEWISNGKAHEIVNKLNANETYTLKEVSTPDGLSFADSIEFTVPKQETITIKMVDHETQVLITKKSTELNEDGSNVVLNGARLQILDKDKKPVTAIKDTAQFSQGDLLIFNSQDTIDITGLLNADTVYYLREVKPVDGYAFADDVKFTVKRDHSVTIVEMTDQPIVATFKKTDITGDKEISGAEIKIVDKNGAVVDSWISDENNPHVINKKLVAGETYTLTEVYSPDGYAYISNIIFTVEKDGTITIGEKNVEDNLVYIKDKVTDVRVSKVDITNQKELPGASLAIKDSNGNIIDEWISTNTPHIIKGKLIASVPDRDGDGKWDVISKYTLVELLPADGYAYAKEIEFIVSPDGTIDKVKMEDKLTHIEVSKQSISNEKELVGAKLQVIDENGNIIEEWISTDKPHVIKGKLLADKTYTLHEDGAPAGYNYAEDITFTVSKDGTVDKVVMKDKPTIVEISKKDITNEEELPGAKLQIIDKDGNVVDEWISTDKPHILEGKLNSGEKYTLHEEGAPDGYGYAKDITFVVSEDGSIDQVVMEDKPTEVEISKVDTTNSKGLSGAKMQIIDKMGKVIEEWITTDQPHVIKGKLNANEEYTLHEEGNPSGYNYAEDIKFIVSKDGSSIKVVMKDKPTVVEVSKTDITGEKELPGAHIEIKDKDGNVIEEWITSDKPHVIEGKLEPGETYYMHEEGAPDGYGYAEDIEFKVSEDGSIDKVHMKDDTLKIKVIKWMNKTSEETDTANMLGGAKLQILDSTGKIVDEWITEEGKAYEVVSKFSSGIHIVPDAVYTLREIEAPEGWSKAKDVTFTAAHDGTVKLIHMVDKKPEKPWTPGEKPHVPTITLTKNNAANMSAGVSGAEYTIYNSNGTIYQTVVTGEDGTVTFTRPPEGTYTYKETKAPEGFMIDKAVYTFTVSNGVVSGTLNVIDYPIFEIEILKKDSETLALLPGAGIEIYDSKGNLVAKGETGIDGVFPFKPEYDDTYTAIEVKAPEGYELEGKVFIKFTVLDGKVTGETTMLNSKNNKVGTITASYDSGVNGKGYAWIDENGKIHFGKTGDEFNLGLMAAGCFIAGFGLIILLKRRKKHEEK
jgi:LPXTG-motif cell wall-anchored protein